MTDVSAGESVVAGRVGAGAVRGGGRRRLAPRNCTTRLPTCLLRRNYASIPMLGWLRNAAGITLPGVTQGRTRGGGVGGDKLARLLSH